MTEFKKSCNDALDYQIARKSTNEGIVVIDLLGNDVLTAIIKTELEGLKWENGRDAGYNLAIGKEGLLEYSNKVIICDAIYHNNETLRIFTSNYDWLKILFFVDSILEDSTFTGAKVKFINNDMNISHLFEADIFSKLKEEDVSLMKTTRSFLKDFIEEINAI